MSEYIEFNEPMISANKVLERWPGVGEKELAIFIEMALDGVGGESLSAYHVHRVLSDGNGKTITECIPYARGACYKDSHGTGGTYDFTGIAFILDDIVTHEKNYPKVLYKVINSVDDAWSNRLSAPKTPADNLAFEGQSSAMRKEPADKTDDQEFYRMICEVLARGVYLEKISPEFVTKNLQALHPLDLKIESLMDILAIIEDVDKIEPLGEKVNKYLEIMRSCDMKCYSFYGNIPQGTNFFSGTNNKEKYEFIQGLLFLLLRYFAAAQCGSLVGQHMIERCKDAEDQLATLKAASTGQSTVRTHAASQARQEKTLNAWKPAINAMIKVAVRCGEEGPALRQQPDFNTMFNELDAVLSDTQMELFRKALPDEHIDRTGGLRGKGTPS